MGGRAKRSGSLSAWTLQVILTFMKVLRFFGDRQCVISLACIRILCVAFLPLSGCHLTDHLFPVRGWRRSKTVNTATGRSDCGRERKVDARGTDRSHRTGRSSRLFFFFPQLFIFCTFVPQTHPPAFGACSHICSFPAEA